MALTTNKYQMMMQEFMRLAAECIEEDPFIVTEFEVRPLDPKDSIMDASGVRFAFRGHLSPRAAVVTVQHAFTMYELDMMGWEGRQKIVKATMLDMLGMLKTEDQKAAGRNPDITDEERAARVIAEKVKMQPVSSL